MGSLVIIAIRRLILGVSSAGIAYTLGVIFFAWESLSYGHAVWHCFVLGGSTCHYVAVLVAVVPTASSWHAHSI